MIFIELFIPPGMLDAQRRRNVAERLGSLEELMGSGVMHPGAAEVVRASLQVVVHVPDTWIAGGATAGAAGAVRYFARAYVPVRGARR